MLFIFIFMIIISDFLLINKDSDGSQSVVSSTRPPETKPDPTQLPRVQTSSNWLQVQTSLNQLKVETGLNWLEVETS